MRDAKNSGPISGERHLSRDSINYYSFKTEETPARRLALGDWLGCYVRAFLPNKGSESCMVQVRGIQSTCCYGARSLPRVTLHRVPHLWPCKAFTSVDLKYRAPQLEKF